MIRDGSRGFAALGDIEEHAVGMDAMRVAAFKAGGVDEGDAGGFARMRQQERAQRRQSGADPLHEAKRCRTASRENRRDSSEGETGRSA
ncbi:MAG TPA: hypothetical protein VM532_15135 [Burkholderiales bacterium]|nr:hypothetical protein [Burkholderiales bacterium]